MSKKKYPALKKSSNTKARRSAIEVDYVDGVYNDKGEQVIRPLNEKEKEWLNQYYEETVRTNFFHGKGMDDKRKEIKNILECDEFKKLSEEQKTCLTTAGKARIKELKKLIKEQNRDDSEVIEELEQELQDLRKKYLLYPDPEDHKKFYTENNKRNNDVLNKAFIEEYTPELMDEIYLKHTENLDYEEEIIRLIEGDKDES